MSSHEINAINQVKDKMFDWANQRLHASLQQSEQFQYRALVLLLFSYFFLILFLFLFALFLVAPLPNETKWIMGIIWLYMAIGFSGVIYYLQVSGSYYTAVHFVLFAMITQIMIGIAVSGGAIASVVTSIAFFIPIISFYLLGLRAGSVWVALIFLSIFLMFLLDLLVSPFVNIVPAEYRAVVSSIIFVEGFLVILLMILIYENTYQSLQEQQQQGQEKTRYLATHDPLTGIANRSYFYQFLETALSKLKKSNGEKNLAFVYIDLVGFKKVNDDYGHRVGDSLLQILATKIQNGIRKQDLVARHGGDEFVILLNGIKDEADLVSIANKIDVLISEFIVIDNQKVSVHPSMGISLFPMHASDSIELERLADQAMYEAKSNKVSWKIHQGKFSSKPNFE